MKRKFSIIKATPHKNKPENFWLLVVLKGQTFTIQTPDWEDDIEVDLNDKTVTLTGDIERVPTEYTDHETGKIKKGIKLCPKLDF